MVNAFSRHNYAAGFARRLMMNKSLRVRIEESSDKTVYGFQAVGPLQDGAVAASTRTSKSRARKKEPPFPAAFEVDNREASNRVDRSHSVSKRGQ